MGNQMVTTLNDSSVSSCSRELSLPGILEQNITGIPGRHGSGSRRMQTLVLFVPLTLTTLESVSMISR